MSLPVQISQLNNSNNIWCFGYGYRLLLTIQFKRGCWWYFSGTAAGCLHIYMPLRSINIKPNCLGRNASLGWMIQTRLINTSHGHQRQVGINVSSWQQLKGVTMKGRGQQTHSCFWHTLRGTFMLLAYTNGAHLRFWHTLVGHIDGRWSKRRHACDEWWWGMLRTGTSQMDKAFAAFGAPTDSPSDWHQWAWL